MDVVYARRDKIVHPVLNRCGICLRCAGLATYTPPWGLSVLAEVCPTTGQRAQGLALIPIFIALTWLVLSALGFATLTDVPSTYVARPAHLRQIPHRLRTG
ncbi:hypothetical protein JCGZ_20137 [Jatropha curcas]|uniref:Uncharacterized protein n=1 Tax=Jatropha curcas TaxID=180498 RepID=A0A067K6S4_JATCU|nr:hypothetical protein JCGZ_20137 [Jatropha curcas]